ncbi:DNA-3-methyladenine glycosylase [Candidatus Thorarchaeota archaeon]|nr:MAG: DNA-3-methyladenine glycosylase [Candidatus Thorarchaeota archaeon]
MREMGKAFFARRTDIVARDLLGKILAKGDLRGKIVETEAYMDEPGSHAHRGNKTPRNEVMFGPPGHIYVYFTYGMHHMLNFVCEEEGTPGAVLIRAVEPMEGMDKMAENRGRTENLTNGPARVTQAFGIDTRHNGQKLGEEIRILDSGEKPSNICTTTRIGLSEGWGLPLRYYIQGNEWVSKK